MSKHTPEPWEYGTFPKWQPGRSNYHVVRPQGEFPHGGWIADFGYPCDDVAEANAQRAVACVNALTGLNPEAVPDVVAALRGLLRYEGIVVEYMGGMGNLDAERNTQQQFTAARAALAKLEQV